MQIVIALFERFASLDAAEAAYADVPNPDIILVPGGPGQAARMPPGPLTDWLVAADKTSTWTTSVCTGALILAGAGLLTGRDATTHWLALDELAKLGANPRPERYVFDGKYATSAGVSAGIDMALALCARLAGDEQAKRIQLAIEYDPHPPFNSGSPASAPPEIVAASRASSRFVHSGSGTRLSPDGFLSPALRDPPRGIPLSFNN